MNLALSQGHRGLTGGSSVSRLLAEHGWVKWPRRPTSWKPEEDEAVRALSAKEAAARTGRTLAAVYCRRHVLGLPGGR